ncbi:isochorismate synthase [Croceitalea dokdonensis]|uniref:isochorismate synthase n=1 Tax=Croceitalea dokdonensis TaxID=346188 RepID=UPI0012FAF3AE|nr:chorismate-binding protein [Croceitalea dokdonensis]
MHFPKRNELRQLLTRAGEHLQKELPFVLFRRPNGKTVQGIFQNNQELLQTPDLKAAGFVFAPFNSNKTNVLIPKDHFMVANWQPSKATPENNGIPLTEVGKKKHIALVEKAINGIQDGQFQKVVVSRTVNLDIVCDAIAIFSKALNSYSNAFCYLWYHPKVGMWLGATPERLVAVEHQNFKTTALAGTLPYTHNEAPQWGTKEIKEQQMVTDFLYDQLTDHLSNMQVSATKTSRAGNLWHLKTDISGKLAPTSSLAEIVTKIHPTSAVCGLPKEAARDFIQKEEAYDREFYTGFLGELDLDGSAHLFVNLRCMQVHGKSIKIYVGGGITEESDPLQEWLETQNKSKTMLSLL